MNEAEKSPEKSEIGSPLLRAAPPLQTKAQFLRELVGRIAAAGLGGNLKIAHSLERIGSKLSRETVRRIRKAPSPPSIPSDDSPKRSAKSRSIIARYPNHVWMADITEVPTFFRAITLKLVVLLDVYARFPLAFLVFSKDPSAADLADLFLHAAIVLGTPRHFVSDQGSQFTASDFRRTLSKLGTKQRFGAISQCGSIAIIERFWRTVKETLDLRGFHAPLGRRHLEEKVDLFLEYYARHRPHQTFRGATPEERYFGLAPANAAATPAPRERDVGKQASARPRFRIVCLVCDWRLPIVEPLGLAA